MPFSDYSNVANATTSAGGGGTPVAGAVIREQSDLGVFNSDGESFFPAGDGDPVFYWQDQEEGGPVVDFGWFTQGSPQPIYQSGVGDLINGHPYISKTAAQVGFGGLVSDFAQGGMSVYALLDRAVGGGNEIILDFNNSGGDGNLQLFLNRSGNVGYVSDGTNVNVAATTTGLQVLCWILDDVANEVRIYRNNVLIGTGVTFFGGGYDAGSGTAYFLSDGNGNNDCAGKILDFWVFPSSHNTSDRTQQNSYLQARGGI